MDLAKVYLQAKDESAGAFESFKRNTADAGAAVDRLKGLLAGLGVALSAGAFANMVNSVVESTAKLHDLSMASGATVESLSEMRSIAKLSGTDMESGIVPALQKLAAKMLEAQTGSGEAGKAFAALGLSVVDAGGKLKDNGEFMVELAGKLSGLENATQRVALAKATLGKAGATLLPFLKDLAENYQHVGKITAEQAALADNYQDTLVKLGFASAATKKEFVLGLLPAMNDVAEALLGAKEKGGGLLATMKSLREDGSIDTWAQNTAIGVGYLIDVFRNFAMAVTDTATALVSLATAGVKIGAGQMRMLVDPIGGGKQILGAVDEYRGIAAQHRADMLGREYGFTTADRIRGIFAGRNDWGTDETQSKRGGGLLDTEAMKDKAAKDSGFDSLLDQLRKKLELDKESTELEKLNLDLQQKKYALITTGEAADLRALAIKVDAKEREQKQLERLVKYEEEIAKLEEEKQKRISGFLVSWSEYRQNLEFETSILGLTETQKQTAVALRKLDMDYQKAILGLSGEELQTVIDIYEKNKALIPDLIAQNEARKEAVDLQKKMLDDMKRLNEDIGRSLTDALLRGFESGKSFAKNFRDMLVNMFKTLVLRPIIQPIATGLAGAVTGALGLSGTANASGNLLSMGSNASNLFGGGTGSLVNDLSLGAGFGSVGLSGAGVAGLGTEVGMFTAASEISGAAAAAGAGAMGGAAAAIPYVGWALAAASLLGGLGGGGGTPAVLTSKDMPGGYAGYASGLGGAVMGNDANQGYRWQGETWSGAFTTEIQGVYDEVERLGKLLGKDTSQLRSIGAQIKTGGFNNPAEILPTVLDQLGTTLARSIIPNFDQLAVAGESATQTLTRLTAAQKTALEDQRSSLMASLPNFLRDLSGKLGITSLTDYKNALSVSDYQTPLDRFSAARGMLNSTYASAIGGDLASVSAFPQLLQQALGIGRDVFASGPEFQALFVEGNRQLNDLLAKQQNTMQEMTAELPVTIMEASQNEIVALREQTKALISSLALIEDQLRLLREAA